jgi:hypothetical protein
MQISKLRPVLLLALVASGGLSIGCGSHEHSAPAAVGPNGADSPAAPTDAELQAKAKQAINDANADAEFEKLKQEIEQE